MITHKLLQEQNQRKTPLLPTTSAIRGSLKNRQSASLKQSISYLFMNQRVLLMDLTYQVLLHIYLAIYTYAEHKHPVDSL